MRVSRRANRNLRREFGGHLRAARRRHGFSQERLGSRAGLSGKFIGEVERGEKSISLDSLAAVARGLGLPRITITTGAGAVGLAVAFSR